eukprot:15472616-Alexandrium_andersonii.AAC.1
MPTASVCAHMYRRHADICRHVQHARAGGPAQQGLRRGRNGRASAARARAHREPYFGGCDRSQRRWHVARPRPKKKKGSVTATR